MFIEHLYISDVSLQLIVELEDLIQILLQNLYFFWGNGQLCSIDGTPDVIYKTIILGWSVHEKVNEVVSIFSFHWLQKNRENDVIL